MPVHALLEDLFFRARIEATSSTLDVPVRFSRAPDELMERLDEEPTALVLVDLGHRAADPVETIRALKARPTVPRIVAFGSHVDRETLTAAREAGADRVLARSAFSERLAEILRAAGAGAG